MVFAALIVVVLHVHPGVDGNAHVARRGRYFACRGNLAGIGFSWEDPTDRSLREQNAIELFSRLQLAQNLAITPSLQVLVNPALNPGVNALTVFGLRGRIAF